MRRALSLLWRWSPVVTAPIAALFLWWLVGLCQDYATFQLRYDLAPHRFSLNMEGRTRFGFVRRTLDAFLRPGDDSGLRAVHLSIPAGTLARLDANLPHSGFDYVDAGLWNGDEYQDVQLRYRGDFLVHWAYPKKSLRIKTKKRELFDGMRRFNLIAPKFAAQIHNHLGYRLAGYLGVLAPHSEMVMLHVNGRLRGLHVLVEQIEETTLRRNRRMPGDVYAGELIAKDAWQGITNFLFDHPGLWTKAAVNNHFPLDARRPLVRLCEVTNSWSNASTHRQLDELLDLEAWGRFSALETLIQYFHTGPMHNWRLYYDPWRTRFEPILWDSNAWGGFDRLGPEPPISLDPNATRLHTLLFANARFVLARHETLRRFFRGGGSERFLREMDSLADQVRRAVAADPHPMPPDDAAIDRALDGLSAHVRRVFAEIERTFLLDESPVLWSATESGLVLQTSGRRPVKRIELHYGADVPIGVRAFLEVPRSSGPVRVELGGVAVNGRTVELRQPLLAQLRAAPQLVYGLIKVFSHSVVPASYHIAIEGLPADAQLEDVRIGLDDGATVNAERRDTLEPAPLDGLFGITGPVTEREPQRWSGTVAVEGTREIGDLTIAPGTVVQLLPGAAVVVRGRLLAEGTQEQPITFEPRADAPWGTLALVGPGASGSRLRHCRLRTGGGLADGDQLFEFSAMLSIHDVQDVAVEHCELRDSRVVDDMVHAVYSSVRFHHCVFERALSDAVDLDLSEGEFLDCQFAGSGNDAIDLMGSRASVERSRFTTSGDKGISVGEDSVLVVVDGLFVDCEVGVQTKDGSIAAIHGGEFVGNGKALDAYGKNWRYGTGGTIHAFRCVLRDNREPPTADTQSAIHLFDSSVGSDPVDGRVHLEAVEKTARVRPQRTGAVALPAELLSRYPGAERPWRSADPGRRGSGLKLR